MNGSRKITAVVLMLALLLPAVLLANGAQEKSGGSTAR